MKTPRRLTLSVVPGIPLLLPGDDLGAIIVAALGRGGARAGRRRHRGGGAEGGVEGAGPLCRSRRPSSRHAHARELAAEVDKDPRLVEVILSESVRVVRKGQGVLIVEHRSGYIMANAGVDQSNVAPAPARSRSAAADRPRCGRRSLARARSRRTSAKRLGVIVSDSFGRPWRRGTVGVALGAAGVPALMDLRGKPDLHGRPLQVTETGFADEVAAAASLLMGQADEGHPVVLVSRLRLDRCADRGRARCCARTSEDLFR